MILFRCDNNVILSELRRVVALPLELKAHNFGWIEDDNAYFNVQMYCDYLNVSHEDKLTGIVSFGENGLSLAALDYCFRMDKSQICKLSSVLIMAIIAHDEKILVAMKQWINGLSPYNLEFARAFVESDGLINDVAKRLFLHRNSVRSRLNRFYDETGMNLRLIENQKVFELCDKYRDNIK